MRPPVATIRANRLVARRSRFCIVKALVVHQNVRGAPLGRHLRYLRRRTDDGNDLVVDRDYIRQGMRDRAQDLVTQDLGPCNNQGGCASSKASASPPSVATLIKRMHRSLTAHGSTGDRPVSFSRRKMRPPSAALIIYASLLFKPPVSRLPIRSPSFAATRT
jgi:hypothetical protein